MAGVPHVNFQVMPVQRLERLAGQEAEPEERRHGRLGEVLGGPAGHLEIGVLEHVGRVDAPAQPSIEAEPDHPPQPLAVPGEQIDQGPRVPPFEANEQVVILSLVLVGHGCTPFHHNRAGLRLSTRPGDSRKSHKHATSPPSAPPEPVLGKKRAGLWTIGPGDQFS